MFGSEITKITKSPATIHLINNAINIIDIKYGQASTDFKPYHNISHTYEVINAAAKIFDSLEIRSNTNLKDLLLIAAAYHDVEYQINNPDNELNSSNIVSEILIINNFYGALERRLIAECIRSTAVNFNIKRGLIHAHNPKSLMARILADADLSTFGMPTMFYWERAYKLYMESYNLRERNDDTFYTFLENQRIKLINHHFYLKHSDLLFPYRDNNEIFISKYLTMLK